MLNLSNPVRYTDEEQAFIDAILKPLGKDGWDSGRKEAKNIKNHISTETIIAQGGRCAYCERILTKGEVAIEHIAHKGLYGEFTYEPFNLVSSCTCCNSPSNKGQKNTLAGLIDRENYANNKFAIVHPYFDTPEEHLKYIDAEHTVFDWNNCSEKGKETIRLFNWNEKWAVYQRQATASMRHYPVEVLKLAAEIAVYK